MKRICEEKIEILDYLDSNAIQAFQRGVYKNYVMYAELAKMLTRMMDEAYEETQKFINLEREFKPVKKECSYILGVVGGNEMKELSLENSK